MKAVILFAVVLIPAYAIPPSHVSGNDAVLYSSGQPQVLAYPMANAGGTGCTLAASLGLENNTSVVTDFHDSQGNSWSRAVRYVGTDGAAMEWWIAPNCKAGANSVSVATTTSVNKALEIMEFANLVANPLDQILSGTNTNTTGSATITVSAEVLLGFTSCNSPQPTAGSGFTVTNSAANNYWMTQEYRVVSTIGTYTAPFVQSNTCNTVGITLAGTPPPVDYTLSGPGSAKFGTTSTNFTVTKTTGTFNGSQTITLSDGGNGGTFTPSVGSSATSSVTVTPTNGASGFTFTYAAAHPYSPRSLTITPTDGQGWTDPPTVGFQNGYDCVSAAATGWTTNSTWTACGGSYPQNGDTATISHAVTCAVTCIVGISPATGGTAALSLGTTGSVEIQNVGILRVRGPVSTGARTTTVIQIDAGGRLTWDSTQAAAPASTQYEWTGPVTTGQGVINFNGNGTGCAYHGLTYSGSTCASMTSDLTGGALPGTINGITQQFGVGGLTGQYATIANMGTATVPAVLLQELNGNPFNPLTLDHFSVYNSGRIAALVNTTSSLKHFATVAGVNTSHNGEDIDLTDSTGTAGRTVTDCYASNVIGVEIDGMVAPWDVSRCIYLHTPQFTATGTGVTGTTANGIMLEDLSVTFPFSTVNYLYYFYNITAKDNPHFFAPYGSAPETIANLVCESPDDVTADTGECIGVQTPAPSSSNLVTVKSLLLLPSKTGKGTSELISDVGNSNAIFDFEHVTGLCAPWCFQMDENGTYATKITVRASILGSFNGDATTKAETLSPPSTPATDPFTIADYNAGLSTITATNPACTLCTGQGNGYAVKTSFTLGVHDLDITNGSPVAPGWVNSNYRLATFDTLGPPGNAVCTAWVTGTVYTYSAAAPTCVSVTNSGVYGSLAINYRLTASHTSGSTTLPDSGASWRTDWEYASLYDLRVAMVTGGTYTVGNQTGLDPVKALITWMATGWTPTNPKYRTTYPGDTSAITNLGAFPMPNQTGAAALGIQ